jgi:hypothetical protein
LLLKGNNDETTQRQLLSEGLPLNAVLGITTGGTVRHLVHAQGSTITSSLCNLFRPGSSLITKTTRENHEPLCRACLRTLEAEVMRAKEAMKHQKDEED